MNPILLIIVKLLTSSALLTTFYFVLFRGKASYTASRIFLLSIPVLSIVFSLVSIETGGRFISFASLVEKRQHVVEPTAPPAIERVSTAETVATELPFIALTEPTAYNTEMRTESGLSRSAESPISRRTAPIVIYIAAILIFAAMIVRQMYSLRRIRHGAERKTVDGYPVWFSRDVKGAFSVMRNIYVNVDTPQEKLAIVIRHEKEHIARHHYIDLALMEFFTVVLWFDPFVWVVRRELRSIHEFQADRGTLAGGVRMHDYMLAILEETTGVVPVMANGMQSSMIKKRFLKMKTENKPRLKLLRTVLTVPFAVALMLFFAFRSVETKAETGTQPSVTELQEPAIVADTITISNNLLDVLLNKVNIHLENLKTEYADVDSISQFRLNALEQHAKTIQKRYEAGVISGETAVSELTHLVETAGEMGLNDNQFIKFERDPDSVGILIRDGKEAGKLSRWLRGITTPREEPKPNFIAADFPGMDFAHHNITVGPDGTLLNPDGIPIGHSRFFVDYDAWFVGNEGIVITDIPASEGARQILRIERGRNETRVTMAVPIFFKDGNWSYPNPATCLVDPETGDRYMVRAVDGNERLGRMSIFKGIDRKVIERTFIFPPLPKKVKSVDWDTYYENGEEIPKLPSNAMSPLTIKDIQVDDFVPRPVGKIIR